jgi:cyclopropane-fatty-acyl-phospholipid synthase
MFDYFFDYFRQNYLINKIKSLPFESVTIYDENDNILISADTDSIPNPITINIKDKEFYKLVADKGELGFGIAYTKGFWETNNISDLCLILCSHMDLFDKELNSSYNPRKYLMTYHKEVADDKRYIMQHYDIGNDFYEKILDPRFMSYSMGLFLHEKDTVEQAVENKLNYIIRKLKIKKTDNVLDIGSGWGYMTQYIKDTTNCDTITGITVSHEQMIYYKEKNIIDVKDGINFLEIDYRDHIRPEFYDKIYSMEMLEHVGKNNLKIYFETISKNLKLGGKACILTNVLTYEKDDKGIDAQNQFILNEIYPGGSIPKISYIMAALNDCPTLRLKSLKLFDGKQYGKVFRYWRSNLEKSDIASIPEYGMELFRAFQYYLASVGGMEEANVLASAFFTLEKVVVPL